MPAAFITCTTPGSMANEHAGAWLRRRVGTLAAEEVTVRELSPPGRGSVWLLHVVTRPEAKHAWEPLLRELVNDLRGLGMRPTVVIDERSREPVVPVGSAA